jgi:hypothetical protein
MTDFLLKKDIDEDVTVTFFSNAVDQDKFQLVTGQSYDPISFDYTFESCKEGEIHADF